MTSPQDDLVQVDGISFSYDGASSGGNPLFEHASLTAAPGDLTGIIGRSGIGKSTLLKVIAGQLAPLGGEIRIADTSSGRLSVLYQAQEPQLLPWRSLLDNVELGLRVLNTPPFEPVGELLRRLGLEDKVSSYPAQLSGGQIERAVLARTLTTPANLYLLDEPLTGTDFPLRLSIEPFLQRFARDHDASIVLVTHDVPQVLALCNHIYVMKSGDGPAWLEPFPVPVSLQGLDARSRRMDPIFGATVECLIELIGNGHD